MKVIGLDIDDTITQTSGYVEKYIIEHPEEFDDPKKLIEDMLYILKGQKISKDIEKIHNEVYPIAIKEVELRENVLDVLNKLKNMGHKIILITARDDRYFPKGAKKLTKEYLKRYNVPYDKLIVEAGGKSEACLENNVDIMIDDSVNACERVKSVGIESLVYSTKVNEHIDTDIPRVYSWLEILEKIK